MHLLSSQLRDLQRALAESNSDKAKNVNELFDGTIFFGDLNYRMNLPKIKVLILKLDFTMILFYVVYES